MGLALKKWKRKKQTEEKEKKTEANTVPATPFAKSRFQGAKNKRFFRLKFYHERLWVMSVPRCLFLFFQHREGVTKVFDRMFARISGPKLTSSFDFRTRAKPL